MIKSIMSEKGGTLMLVFGFIIMIAIVIAPLAMSTNIGLLQAKTNGNSEKSFTEAHSGMTIFARMYEDMQKLDESNNTKENIERLVNSINSMNQLHVRAEIIENSSNNPIAVTFSSEYGVGNQVRQSKLKYSLLPLHVATAPPIIVPTPTPTVGPTPVPTPPVPTTDKKVIFKNSTKNVNKKLFAACYYQPATGEVLEDSKFYNGNFDELMFHDWFGDAADYYFHQSSNVFAKAFKSITDDSRFSQPASLNSTITSNDISTYKSGSAIMNGGNVNIGGTTSTEITQDVIINADSGGNSVVASGDLYFKDIVKAQIVFSGNVQVGGNMRFRQLDNNKTISFNRNVIVKGNVIIGDTGTNGTIVIEGDLIVGGSITVKNTLKNFIVKGDIIVNGDINYENTIQSWQVNGSMAVKGNIKATNGITSFNIKKDLVVQGGMVFTNPISESRDGVQGKFEIGGSLKVNGLVEFKNTVYALVVGGDFIVNNSLTFYDVIKSNFHIGGSILIKGNLLFKNTLYDLNVLGDVIVEGNFTVENTLEQNFNISGSLVAKGNISFKNTVKSAVTIKIGENLISKSNLTFNDNTLNGSLSIGNMLLVFKDASFHNLSKDWKSNQMKGFYVGGTTYFNPQYSESWYVSGLDSGQRQESICIK